jgi:transaldolase
MRSVNDLKIKLFLDGANVGAMREAHEKNPLVKGFTTNPTLMKKAGVSDYAAFAKEAIAAVGDLPISFEVFSDEFPEMEAQAKLIASWGGNTYVKIPVTNTKGQSAAPLIKKLAEAGVALNVTAILTLEQVKEVAAALSPQTPSIVSVFAGRVADTGRDPKPMMSESVAILKSNAKAELLWASPRELLNLFEAEDTGCHIITATKDIIDKMALVGKDLGQYSLETVKMFYNDASAAGYKL